jgi:TonB family protein
LTVTATASSGGGLRDYGIFRNEAVFTVYMEMTHSPHPAPSWTLQYALLRQGNANSSSISLGAGAVRMNGQLLPPFPRNKVQPEFPPEIVAKNLGRIMVVYGEITSEGKVERLRIIQSPNPLLNQAALEAVSKWTFRPAEMNGQPAAVKALFGIPLSLPPS